MPQPNPLTIARVLDKAADLIEPEGAWTQRGYAKTLSGEECDTTDPEAVCFCMNGAIAAELGLSGGKAESFMKHNHLNIYDRLRGGEWSPIRWNDAPERTQAEVVAALREAAAKARESAQ